MCFLNVSPLSSHLNATILYSSNLNGLTISGNNKHFNNNKHFQVLKINQYWSEIIFQTFSNNFFLKIVLIPKSLREIFFLSIILINLVNKSNIYKEFAVIKKTKLEKIDFIVIISFILG